MSRSHSRLKCTALHDRLVYAAFNRRGVDGPESVMGVGRTLTNGDHGEI